VATSGLVHDDVDFLSLLSDVNRRRCLEGSTRTAYQAGTIAYRAGDPPVAFVVARGLVRVYWTIPEGRQATVSFIHSNELLGGGVILKRAPWAYAQAVVETTLTALDPETVTRLVATEIEVANALALHLAVQVRHAFRLLAVRSLGNIPERLAYDLLDRACRNQLALGRLEVRATHAELADSIGSSREVVSRALRGLRAARLVRTAPGLVRVIDPMGLAATVRAFAAPSA
jgi:CRP-like cAMP-binding protein